MRSPSVPRTRKVADLGLTMATAAAQIMLFVSDRQRFSAARLTKDAIIASLAFAYALWTIAGSGYQVVFRGFMLMAGIPVYLFMKWRAAQEPVPAPVSVEIAPKAMRVPVGVGQ